MAGDFRRVHRRSTSSNSGVGGREGIDGVRVGEPLRRQSAGGGVPLGATTVVSRVPLGAARMARCPLGLRRLAGGKVFLSQKCSVVGLFSLFQSLSCFLKDGCFR